MSDDSVALATIPPAPTPSEQDYEAILGAVVETARGRWFLAEYARRNRNADTSMVLDAIDRIEMVLRGDRAAQPDERMRVDLVEMAKAIARTRAEIAAIKPDAEHDGKIGAASEELDSIVRTTERATSDVLAAAEQIQEIAWTMREADIDPALCDKLDGRATEIYTACSFQDLTGQRIHKVIEVLHYLESRINAMIAIWGDAGEAALASAATADDMSVHAAVPVSAGLDQADVDMVLHLEPDRAAEAAPGPAGAFATVETQPAASARASDPTFMLDGSASEHAERGTDTVSVIPRAPQPEDEAAALVFVCDPDARGFADEDMEPTAAPEPQHIAAGSDAPLEPPPAGAGLAVETLAVAAIAAEPPQPAVDPLAAVRALSDEEKIALCH